VTITSITKDGGYLVIVEDGVTKRRSIVYEDAVCSLPPTGYAEVGVIYVDETNNLLVVQYNGSSVEIELDAASGLYLPLAGGTMSGLIAMGANKITGLADPTAAQDAATRAYVLARCGLYLPLTGGTVSGNVIIGNTAYNIKIDGDKAGIYFGDRTDSWDLLLKWNNANQLAVRNAADDAYKDFQAAEITARTTFHYLNMTCRAVLGYLSAQNDDGAAVTIRARDTGNDLVEIARLQGAADPYFQLTLPCVLSPASEPGTLVEGHFWYDATADKLKYRDASAVRTLAIVADMTAHVAAADPHTGYQKESEKGAASGYASLNVSSKVTEQPASITDHLEGAPTEDLATKAPTSEWAYDHVAGADPHTGYQKESEKGAASGYASLDASSVVEQSPKVHAARHQTGGADILYVPRTYVWFVPGTLATGTEQAATFRMKRATTVESVELHVKTAPTGAALIIDINEGGTTLFNEGDSGVRPEIDIDGYTEDGNEVLTDTAIAAGAELTMDIDQIGSTLAGEDLTVLLHCKEPII